MQQWEYMGVRLMPDSEKGRVIVMDPAGWKGTPLNELGRQGWEVVGVFRDNFWVLLKRPLAAPGVAPAVAAAEATSTPAPSASVESAVAQESGALFGLPDTSREQELERRLQEELQRRREGHGRGFEGGRRR